MTAAVVGLALWVAWLSWRLHVHAVALGMLAKTLRAHVIANIAREERRK